jgi:NAD+ synthase (glutamine-hydrolysing)
MLGIYRVAAASPRLAVAGTDFNSAEIIKMTLDAAKERAAVIVFPELSITAYTCGDLFFQSVLLDAAISSLHKIADATAKSEIIAIVGLPLRYLGGLYNCAAVVQHGKIAGIVPKSSMPNYREFYEKRWFDSGADIDNRQIMLAGSGNTVPFGSDLIFNAGAFSFGIELCEDLWSVIPPSCNLATAGASVIFNLSASNEVVAKSEYRRQLIEQQSARAVCAYIYASAGVFESTTDLVFSGHCMIAENGRVTAENERFQRSNSIIFADVDCDRINNARISESSFRDQKSQKNYRNIPLAAVKSSPNLNYLKITKHPFVPANPDECSARCREIFQIQTAGLAKRFEYTGAKKMVIGISGGLDSTLALLVCAETCKLLQRPASSITAVTMPGFGTTDRTYNNAVKMCRQIGADLREIDIIPACLQHFQDIGHNPENHDVTYENVQARERTQLLMDIANRESGLVIGTGDLSEIALGWSTYSGDHISMYSVNCSVPKTLIRYIIQWVADSTEKKLSKILNDVINTPVSPELLPNSRKNAVNQKTEEIIGPYELHDFFLYHIIKYGAPPAKVRKLAEKAFAGDYSSAQIKQHLELFVRRFFSQQFKRSCIPDGPKVGTISLSPRGDWRMPSDAAATSWLNNLQ